MDIHNNDVGLECRVDDNNHDEDDDESVVDDGNDHHSLYRQCTLIRWQEYSSRCRPAAVIQRCRREQRPSLSVSALGRLLGFPSLLRRHFDRWSSCRGFF